MDTELIERSHSSGDWVVIALVACLLIIALARSFSRHSLASYFNYFRVVRYQPDGDYRNLLPYVFAGTSVFLIVGGLLVYYAFAKTWNLKDQATDYLIVLTVLSFAWLSKHYTAKLLFTLFNRYDGYRRIVFYLRFYRFFTAVLLWAVTTVFYFTMGLSAQTSLFILAGYAIIHAVIHLAVWFKCRKSLSYMPIPFSLYLCALEILPYILLYKYFTA